DDAARPEKAVVLGVDRHRALVGVGKRFQRTQPGGVHTAKIRRSVTWSGNSALLAVRSESLRQDFLPVRKVVDGLGPDLFEASRQALAQDAGARGSGGQAGGGQGVPAVIVATQGLRDDDTACSPGA